MAANQTIGFKDPSLIIAWLDTALEKEKEKYKKCPVIRDLNPGHEVANGWGYVICGYFLVEESFKTLLYVRDKNVPKDHSLFTLFDMLDQNDKTILSEYYIDYKLTTSGNIGMFPFISLDDFLVNLDGAKGKGSFDWRYFLIEENRSREMPLVSVDYLHEIVYGCTRIIECAHHGRSEPSQHTHTWRIRWERKRKYNAWLTARRNSDGWDDLGDRLEILWGPDYLGRYDLLIFRGKKCKLYFSHFSKIPDVSELPVVDKVKEVEDFDVEQGYRSIGVARTSRPSTN